MAKYKPYSYGQGQFIPIFFSKQILPGTFEVALNQLIDNKLNLTNFDKKLRFNLLGNKSREAERIVTDGLNCNLMQVIILLSRKHDE
jgi:hypothetical protein